MQGEAEVRLHSFLRSAQEGDSILTLRTLRSPLTKEPLAPTETKAVWSSEPVWTFRSILLAIPVFEFRVIQPVASKTNQMSYLDSLTVVHTA